MKIINGQETIKQMASDLFKKHNIYLVLEDSKLNVMGDSYFEDSTFQELMESNFLAMVSISKELNRFIKK